MKRRILQCLSLILCLALFTLPAAAAETEDQQPDPLGPVQVYGTLTWLDNGGMLVQNSNEEDPLHEVILHGESIICLDAVTGAPMDIQDLKNGDTIYAWVGPAMTMSLPPQATALLVLGNIPADYTVPQYYQVAQVQPYATPAIEPPIPPTSVTLTTTSGKTLTITDQARITPYLTKNIVTLESLIPGTRMLVWQDSEGAVSKVLVFAYEYLGYVSWQADGTVFLNGASVSQKAKTASSGEVLLPIRDVAEALGMNVYWDDQAGAVVAYSEELAPEHRSSNAIFSAVPGGLVYGYEADGTAWEVSATCVIEEGVTYLSASVLAQLLNLYPAG